VDITGYVVAGATMSAGAAVLGEVGVTKAAGTTVLQGKGGRSTV